MGKKGGTKIQGTCYLPTMMVVAPPGKEASQNVNLNVQAAQFRLYNNEHLK